MLLRTMKRALITGITGQDGSYLADLLLSKGYEVHGIVRRASTSNTERIGDERADAVYDGTDTANLHLHYGDLNDGLALSRIMSDVRPDEVYNLAAMSHVQVSFDMPEYTASTNGGGVGCEEQVPVEVGAGVVPGAGVRFAVPVETRT